MNKKEIIRRYNNLIETCVCISEELDDADEMKQYLTDVAERVSKAVSGTLLGMRLQKEKNEQA